MVSLRCGGRVYSVLLGLIALACSRVWAQDAAGSQAPLPTLRTSTQLVVVDVLVEDSKGHPVHGLTRANFQVEENKAPQTIHTFDEHAAADTRAAGPAPPALPPGSFTNYTPVPPSGSLTVLLIDALNTPRADQTYLRDQLAKYVRSAAPGQTVAIFGLNTKLYMLQGFTSDPATLKRAVDLKLSSRGSDLLDDPNGSNDGQHLSDLAGDLGPGAVELVANLQQFEADSDNQRLQVRAQDTLDAMNAMAHYLSNFPGRKNLIWFSGSFPLNLLPDPSLANPFSSLQLNEHELRETTDLLTHAQVAVYPVDARGVQVQPMYDSSSTGRKYAANPATLGKDLTRFETTQSNEHATMDQMAGDTGGHAYYGTNALADAVRNAVDSGSNFYTLTYQPTDRDPHGEFRAIHIRLAGQVASAGLQLSYRHGYYASERSSGASLIPENRSASADAKPDPATAYARLAMSHGAPTPEDILFQVSVKPASDAAEATLAPGNQPGPGLTPTGPFHRVSVDFAALPGDFVFALQPSGHRVGLISFKAYVFDPEGKLLEFVNQTDRFDLPPDAYKRIMDAGVGMHLVVSVPATHPSYLRLGVEDVGRNRFGVVEVETAYAIKASRAAP